LGKEKMNDSDGEEGAVKPFMSGLEADDRFATFEELRERLQRKLEEFRSGPNCANLENANKRDERKIEFPEEKVVKEATESLKELVFGNVKLQNGEMQGKRKVSKHKELERAKKLEEVKKNDPEKGEAIAKKEAWKAAMNRASGIKVHDDPKLIKRSIQKWKNRQQKIAVKWEERVQSSNKGSVEGRETTKKVCKYS
jgi:hypothetical protein